MTAETCGTVARTAVRSSIERVVCADSFAQVAPQWLELETRGVATPYQTFDWSRAWGETAGAASGMEPMLVTVADGDGRTVAILPLGIRRKAGLSIASFLGDKHSNINLGLFDRHVMPRLQRADIESILRQAAARGGSISTCCAGSPCPSRAASIRWSTCRASPVRSAAGARSSNGTARP